jgi:hypothetical protein
MQGAQLLFFPVPCWTDQHIQVNTPEAASWSIAAVWSSA